MAKDNYLPASFQINVDPAINEREGKRAWRRIKRGSALEDQLKLARWLAYGSRLAQAEAGVQRAEGRGYSVAFNRWLLEHDMAAVSAQMRANAIFVIDNWPEAEMAIANANDHQKQTWALNGLRTAIEMARSEKWRAAERKPPREKPYNYGDGAWRAMEKIGLVFDRTNEMFALGDEAVFFSFARFLLRKSLRRDGVEPEAPVSEDAPPADKNVVVSPDAVSAAAPPPVDGRRRAFYPPARAVTPAPKEGDADKGAPF